MVGFSPASNSVYIKITAVQNILRVIKLLPKALFTPLRNKKITDSNKE